MKNKGSRSRTDDTGNVWEQQCEELRQHLASSTSLTTSLLRNQQTLLSIMQSQAGSFNPALGSTGTKLLHLHFHLFQPPSYPSYVKLGLSCRACGLQFISDSRDNNFKSEGSCERFMDQGGSFSLSICISYYLHSASVASMVTKVCPPRFSH